MNTNTATHKKIHSCKPPKPTPKSKVERVVVSDEILVLVSKYVTEKVVGQTSLDECIHIATATICKVDILVSR